MYLSTLLALALPLMSVLAAPNPALEPVLEPALAPAPACSSKRDLIPPELEKRGCPYSSCDDCYNRQLSCVACANPHGCQGDSPVPCTYCIIYCNANCC